MPSRKLKERQMRPTTSTTLSSSWIFAMLLSLKRVEMLLLPAWLTRLRCKLLLQPRAGRALFVAVVICVLVYMANLQLPPLISLPRKDLFVPSRLRCRQPKRQHAHHWKSRPRLCHPHKAPHRPCSPPPHLHSRPSTALLKPLQLVSSLVQPRELAKATMMPAPSVPVVPLVVHRAKPTSTPNCMSLALTAPSSKP
jgi:hypothetical protein